MEVSRVEPLTFSKIFQILRATHISASKKEQFIKANRVEIDRLFAGKINSESFKTVMQGRPLKIFRPLKNSYTKAGDKKIIAETLGIKPSQVDAYIEEVSDCIENGTIKDLPKDRVEIAKAYAYRHGKKDEVINFLDYELADTGDIIGVLYRTLAYNTGGAADYFVRPIHRMDNRTLVDLYEVVDRNLKNAMLSGNINETDRERTAEWALVRIYEIQNNQKLKNALKLRKELD